MARRLRRSIPPIVLLLSAIDPADILARRAERDAPNRTICRPVDGVITARVKRLAPTLQGLRMVGAGTSTGELGGALELSVLRQRRADAPSAYDVKLRIETGAGEVVVTGDDVSVSDGSDGAARRVTGQLDVRGEAGELRSLRGQLNASGSVSIGRRELTIRYLGTLCGLPNEPLSQAPNAVATRG